MAAVYDFRFRYRRNSYVWISRTPSVRHNRQRKIVIENSSCGRVSKIAEEYNTRGHTVFIRYPDYIEVFHRLLFE